MCIGFKPEGRKQFDPFIKYFILQIEVLSLCDGRL